MQVSVACSPVYVAVSKSNLLEPGRLGQSSGLEAPLGFEPVGAFGPSCLMNRGSQGKTEASYACPGGCWAHPGWEPLDERARGSLPFTLGDPFSRLCHSEHRALGPAAAQGPGPSARAAVAPAPGGVAVADQGLLEQSRFKLSFARFDGISVCPRQIDDFFPI